MEAFVNLLTIPGILVVSGPKGSGKTVMVKYICYSLAKLQKTHLIKVVCPTAYNGAYSFLPEEHVYENYNEIMIGELLDEQIELKKDKVKRPTLLVLDDCIGSANFKAPLWNRLATTCRHPDLTVVIVTQQIRQLPPTLRDNSDTVLVFRTIDVDNLDALYDICGRWKWRSQKDFEEFILKNTENRRCIVINKGQSVNIVTIPKSFIGKKINII